MLKRGDQGPAVKALQETLVTLGYPLPRWGADGDLGTESLEALAQCLQDHGKALDSDKNKASDRELAFLQTLKESLAHAAKVPLNLFDLRAESERKKILRKRAWTEVTGVTLHQTACVMGERPARWANAGCHLGVTRGGKIIWLHDFDWAVVHGNGFNSHDVGIEMDGHYAGVEGDLKTYWRPAEDPTRQPLFPTPALIDAAQATVRWIVGEVARHGGCVKYLHAHRQSSSSRQSDPGSALWQKVALPLMAELRLSDGGKGYKVGTGYVIPEAWDARYKGVKY